MSRITPVEFAPIYTRKQLKADPEFTGFVKKWVVSNFLRKDEEKSEGITVKLSPTLLEKFMSAKQDKPYILYRGIQCYVKNEIYKDRYPSSWTTSIKKARQFARGWLVMRLELPAKYVLVDLEHMKMSIQGEKEVIIMPGMYRISILDFDETIPVPKTQEMMNCSTNDIAKKWPMTSIVQYCIRKHIPHSHTHIALINYIKSWLGKHIVPGDDY